MSQLRSLPIPSGIFGFLVLALFGCSTNEPAVVPVIDVQSELVPANPKSPRAFFAGPTFEGVLATHEPLILDEEYLLDFQPVVLDERVHSALEIRTYILTDQREILLSTTVAKRLESDGGDVDEWFRQWGNPTTIDLSAYKGKSVRLKWLLGEASAGIRGQLIRPALRLKRDARNRLPDVLFVCSDTHRYDFAFGSKGKALMPTLQSLAEESTVYTNAFSTSSWTLPAIASTLSGLFPQFHGTGLRVSEEEAKRRAREERVQSQFDFQFGPDVFHITSHHRNLTTLPEVLRLLGYRTALVGGNSFYFASRLSHDGFGMVFDFIPSKGSVLNEAASKLLENAPSEEPLFLIVHYLDVHHWEPWMLKNQTGLDSQQATRSQVVHAYSESVRQSDSFLASLLAMWKTARDWDNTLLVFYSDHGEHLKDPLVSHGQTMSDVLLHVPLLVKYPGDSRSSPRIVHAQASLVDLPSTVLGAIGSLKNGMLGSGHPLARREPSNHVPRPLFADYQLYADELSSVRLGRNKLIVNHTQQTMQLECGVPTADGCGSTQTPEAEEARKKLESIYSVYEHEGVEALAALGTRDQPDAAEALEALKALGYLR